MQRERELGGILVPVRNSFPEAVYCLCTHNTVFQVVAIYDSFGKNEFRNSSERHCMSLKHLLLFVDWLSIGFDETQSVNCFDLIWRLLRIGVKYS